ncbi:MAG: YceI family protein [Bacteroidetes bacterium]|nr:YceI family protein [Bacteroidota bacterium]
MKSTVLSVALAATMLFAFAACNNQEDTAEGTATTTLADGTMNVDTSASEVEWNGTLVGVYTHTGNVSLNSGSVTIQDGKIAGGSFEVDLTSISPTDDNFNAEEDKTPEKLVGHLKSPDFFNVAEHPNATFEITGSEGDEVMGNLTIRGVTHPETVRNVVISEQNGQAVISGELTFDRNKYEVAFKHPMQDMVISDDVKMDVKLVAGN